MPQLLKHIDAIAREKQRDVLMLRFGEYKPFSSNNRWRKMPERKAIIQWLKDNRIGYQECADLACENATFPWQGQLYLDVAPDDTSPEYQKLCAFLEHPDGTCRFAGVGFFLVPLEMAMENARHDEPGFWEGVEGDEN